MRRYPWPERRGDKVVLVFPDGEEAVLEPLTATRMATAWLEAISGVACYQATTVIPKLERELDHAS